MIKNIINSILSLSRFSKIKIIIFSDIAIAFAINSYFLYFKTYSPLIVNLNDAIIRETLIINSLLSTLIVLIFYYLGSYSNQLKYLSNKAILEIAYVFIILTSMFYAISTFFSLDTYFTYSFLVIFFLGIVISRLLAQSIVYKRAVLLKNILIYGAGSSGNKLYKSLNVHNPEYSVVGFIDDDQNRIGEKIDSINIFSSKKIKELKKKFNCYGIFIALPSINSERKKEILMQLIDEDLVIKIVPSIKSIVEKKSNFSDMKNIRIEDIIGRQTVNPINKLLEKNINNKTILITGAGGSIGSELTNQVLNLNPKKVVAVDMSEISLFNLKNSLIDKIDKVDIHLGSVSDEVFIKQIIKDYSFDIVFHAAAYKHVSMVEENILYAVMNNIYSTFLISKLCVDHNIDKFVLVSTDKAVRPSNYMGKSKLIAEMIVNKMNNFGKTQFNTVRFGNVLNSSGSVLSIFENQIKLGKPITVTDKKVTRYFMSIPEAAQLIIQSSAIKNNHNTFILEMGESYNIYELAKKIIRINGFKVKEGNGEGIEIKITSLQPGEKLYEELAIKEEDLKDTIHPKIYSTKEEYEKFNIFEWIQSLKKLYNKNDRKEFKALINSLISSHERLN
tara:strand:- start:3189 stop:5036 length:1848 start_codon:yes stop_codon:yes gene_type:complete